MTAIQFSVRGKPSAFDISPQHDMCAISSPGTQHLPSYISLLTILLRMHCFLSLQRVWKSQACHPLRTTATSKNATISTRRTAIACRLTRAIIITMGSVQTTAASSWIDKKQRMVSRKRITALVKSMFVGLLTRHGHDVS